jgi:transposase
MRFVAVKTVEQSCARAIHRARDLLVRQRTQAANCIRGLLYELGVIAAKGSAGIKALLERIEAEGEARDKAIPEPLLAALRPLARQWRKLDEEICGLDGVILAEARKCPLARRLMKIPGIGPITAHAMVAAIGDGSQFKTARDFAAWLGLTRKCYDTGGKAKLTGSISKAGDRGLRRLFVLGASSWLRWVRNDPKKGSAWVNGVLARRPVKVAVVAQAAKTARIAWAVLTSGQEYRDPAKAQVQAQVQAPAAA